MGIVIGIDVGISTTKIVGIKNNKISAPIHITAADPITSLYGAFGKYLHDNNIELKDVEHVMLTGVGAAYIDQPIYGLPTSKSQEFVADGLGARFESKLDHTIVVSMGTGTSFVKCDGDDMRHIGGIGVGGGTLAGLARIMLNTSDIKTVATLAQQGDVRNIDLTIGDISPQPLPGLPMDTTASNFARAQSDASKEDIAAGIIKMVLQSIGSAASRKLPYSASDSGRLVGPMRISFGKGRISSPRFTQSVRMSTERPASVRILRSATAASVTA